MKIDKVSMQGPCKGVIRALKIINETLENTNVKKPIYMLGKIVHNDNIISSYKDKGIIVLDGDKRIEMVKQIKEGTVIITAHGVGDIVYDYLINNAIDYIDATCQDVLKTNNLIKDKLNEGYKIIYVGTLNHPEAEGMLSLSSDIHFLSSKCKEDEVLHLVNSLKGQKVFCTCQTTLSFSDVLKIYNQIISIDPTIETASEVCNATRVRQKALKEEVNGHDVCLVVGDRHSNNTNSLKHVCELNSNALCYLVETVNDLNSINFSNCNSVIITSGASTPKCIVNEIEDQLKKYSLNYIFKSNLTLDDYIKIK